MIFFAFDLDNYYDWRGFYYDYKDFVPGPIHTTTEEMIEYIQHVDERFDKKKGTGIPAEIYECLRRTRDRADYENDVWRVNMVSVIIPCYNARQYICEALASAVAQEYVHEVILVDDCSTDDSVACVQAWLDVHAAQTADISIRVLQNAENSGVAVSRNWGVQEAGGNILHF